MQLGKRRRLQPHSVQLSHVACLAIHQDAPPNFFADDVVTAMIKVPRRDKVVVAGCAGPISEMGR